MSGYNAKPVGMVRNDVALRSDMRAHGVPSKVMIFPRYRKALKGLKKNSHVWVLCWLHRAERKTLKARPRKISSNMAERGVFSMRSPDRPNPVSLTCAKITGIRRLEVGFDSLDVINGTPVIDIKPYSTGIDCVPSAGMPDYASKYRAVSDEFLRGILKKTAENYCGKLG